MKHLLEKYNVQGPRYTSYPTVPYWQGVPGPEEWVAALRQAVTDSAARSQGAAIYIHIPFCEALCTYCGCTTRITKRHELGVPYVQSVLAEWRLYQELLQLDAPVPVAEIHLGGGTPTWLSPAELEMLMTGILQHVRLLPSAEMSLEVDPRVTTTAHLQTLYQLGFHRLSLGVQDFDPKVQQIVNRIQSVAQVEELTAKARAFGFSSINYDLIYGLPLQTPAGMTATITEVCRLRPDRIAFYAYAHVPWIKPGQRKYTDGDLPQGADKHALYQLGRGLLEAAGYREIGMDHFALPTDKLWQASDSGQLHRNFMGYMPQHVHPMFGLGMSAIGDAWTMFAQNLKTVEEYQAAVAAGRLPIFRGHTLSQEDQILRRHILNLMTRFQTDWGTAAAYTDVLETVPPT
jgi:oxygen-independent coproporphyrinogen-3 oxidase